MIEFRCPDPRGSCPHVRGGTEGTQWCSLNGPGNAVLLRSLLDEAFATMEQADHRSLVLKATQLRQRLAEGSGT